jgi:hypothetical protein
MPRFHFQLRTGSKSIHDTEGIECADLAAARQHAIAVALELMNNAEKKSRHWSIVVWGENNERLSEVFFADLDQTLSRHPAEMRHVVEQTCRRFGALADTLASIRATIQQSRVLVARSQGKAFLVLKEGRGAASSHSFGLRARR